MREGRDVYRVSVGRPEGKRPLGRPRRRWEDDIKMDLRETGIDEANRIQLAQKGSSSAEYGNEASVSINKADSSLTS
jgi:hypothetical protein